MVVLRAPKVIVAPLIGVPPGVTVTVPVSVPPFGLKVVHPGNPKAPILVSHRMFVACEAGLAYSLVYQNVQPSGSSVMEL